MKERQKIKFHYQKKNGEYIEEIKKTILCRRCEKHKSTRYINVVMGSNGVAMRKDKNGFFECEERLPELYTRKENCCGCTACYSNCPIPGAIIMLPDEEGFLFPVVDASICIRCHKCEKSCVFKSQQIAKA